MGTWYLEHKGRRFNWSKDPTYRCPLAVDADELLKGELADTFAFEQASDLLGLTGVQLARVVQRAHRGNRGHRHRDEDGRLTENCEQCGGRMDRLGFACWIDRPFTKAELAEESTEASLRRVSRRLNEAFGTEGARKRERSFYAQRKADAERWARRELAQAKERPARTGSSS